MAARSLRLTASARWPIASAGTKARSKCTPSTSASTVRTSARFRSGSITAASSPMPTSIQSGAAGWRGWIRAMSSRSVMSATVGLFGVIHRAGLTNHGDLDLAGVLELVLDSSRDILRQPDRLLVGDLLALDHDANLASRLQGERLRDALERIGNAFELFEAFDVRLEDVSPRAGSRGRNRVGGLDDHGLERRPVDVHVMRGHRHHNRLALAVLAQKLDSQ